MNQLSFKGLRGAIGFFLLTLSTAYLFSIGVKLTGWFTRAPEVPAEGLQGIGISILIGVGILVVGAGIRRLSAAEMQSALLGASAVLLATPVSNAVITNSWSSATAVVSGLGILTLLLGLLIAMTRHHNEND